MTVTARWDAGIWDADTWGPAGAVWGDTWDWWVQNGPTRAQTLSPYIVEARWTTDSYTPGDGTFRGDVQPGRLALRIVDPHGTLQTINKTGQIWGCYRPTGATWCFFVDTIARPLVAPGDPAGGYRVISASSWPARLTTTSYGTGRDAETVSARFAYLVGQWQSDYFLSLPAVTADITADNHVVPANVGAINPWIQIARDAAANGVFWLEAIRDPAGFGRWIVHYDLWGALNPYRSVPNNQIVAGTVTEQGIGDLVTKVSWAGTSAAGVATAFDQYGAYHSYGLMTYGPMRVLADLAGADLTAVTNTGAAILNDRGDPTYPYISAVSFVSGARRTPSGTIVAWDPTMMVWAPNNVMRLTVSGVVYSWRVTSTAHTLTARTWGATASLVRYTVPATLTPVATERLAA